MNLNPCYGGYANQLSMKCEKTCTYFQANPYYIIEPTADLVKIYEMCNALFPIYDLQNVSNFIFIPVEWARNLFQSWTRDVTCSASNNQLSRTSKIALGRKKVLILLVNKPDWFEPGELTYLGFDNDASEFPVAESDKIDFSINYSDTSKKFLNGDTYNGTIAGMKKIIKYTAVGGKGRLTFPHKGTVHLKVTKGSVNAGIGAENLNWVCRNNNGTVKGVVNTSGTTVNMPQYPYSVTWARDSFFISGYDILLKSSDGIRWILLFSGSSEAIHSGVISFKEKYYYGRCSHSSGGKHKICYSNDGSTWNYSDRVQLSIGNGDFYDMTCSNNTLIAVHNYSSSSNIVTSTDGTSWSTIRINKDISRAIYDGSKFLVIGNGCILTSSDGSSWEERGAGFSCNQIAYGSGSYVAATNNGIYQSSNGVNWSICSETSSISFKSVTYGDGLFVAVTSYDGQIYISRDSGETWSLGKNQPDLSGNDYEGNHIAYSDTLKRFVVVGKGQQIYTADWSNGNSMNEEAARGTLKFTNVSGDTAKHTITNEQEFLITADKITGGSEGDYYIEFEVSNVKLISAEIDNLQMDSLSQKSVSYTEGDITNYSSSGTVLSWGTRTITERVTDTINFLNGETYKRNIAYVPTYSEEDYTETLDFANGNTNGEFISYSPKLEMRTLTETMDLSTGAVSSKAISYESTTSTKSETDYCSASIPAGEILSVTTNQSTMSVSESITIGSGVNSKTNGNLEYSGSSTSGTLYIPERGDVTIKAYGSSSSSSGSDLVWQSVSSGTSSDLHCVKYLDDGKFWAVGANGAMCYSSDGMNWTYLSPSSRGDGWTGHIHGISYGNGKYVAAARGAKILYSNGGSSWTTYNPSGDVANCAVYGNGVFAVGMDSGYTVYSSSGTSWSSGTSGGGWRTDALWTGSQFVMVGENGRTSYCTNGYSWTFGSSPTSESLCGVAYDGSGKYVAAGFRGALIYSSNGQSWSSANSPTSSYYYGVAYGVGKFYIVTSSGSVYYSTDGYSWTSTTGPSISTGTE